MDLRKERTKQNIRDAYTKLRRQKPIEKITIKEVADLAMINKATFYRHYEDIYQLADEIEDEYLDRIVEMVRKGTPVTDIVGYFIEVLEELYLTFPYPRKEVLVEKQHAKFMELILERRPELRGNIEKEVIISAGLIGSIISFMMYHDKDREQVKRGLQSVARILEEAFA